jgi:hypothetical protein
MKIKPNTTIASRSIGDSNCIYKIKIISRTAKMATIVDTYGETRKAKIHTDSSGEEYIKPESYSFAPIFKASRVVEFIEEMAQQGKTEVEATSVTFVDGKSVFTFKFN